MPASIRRAEPGEAAALAALGARLFREAYEPTHPEPTLSRYLAAAFSPESMARRLADPGATLLVVEGEPGAYRAYAHLREAGPEDVTTVLDRPLPGARPLEIVRFYVDARWHGDGTASALMDACDTEARARGCDLLWLQAWQLAGRALAFYAKMGFERVGTAVFPFGERLDADFVLARCTRAAPARTAAPTQERESLQR